MLRIALLAAVGLTVAAPALAQSTDAAGAPASSLPDPNDQSDRITIGAGGAIVPDYEGSRHYRIVPGAAVIGRVSGISFVTRGTSLAVDVIPRGSGKLSFDAGPIAGIRLNRTSHVDDPVVNLLPRRKTAVELGGFAGVSYHGLTNPYDSLGAKVEVVHDVASAHRSTIVSPTVDFSTPLSKTTLVSLSGGLDFVTTKYAQYYFGITPSDTLVSGLPTYSPNGGLKDWKVNLVAAHSLSGNLLHGLSLVGSAGYSELQGDFKRSPIVADRGRAGQWLGALGLAYTF